MSLRNGALLSNDPTPHSVIGSSMNLHSNQPLEEQKSCPLPKSGETLTIVRISTAFTGLCLFNERQSLTRRVACTLLQKASDHLPGHSNRFNLQMNNANLWPLKQ